MQMKRINAAKLDQQYSGGKTNDPQIVSGMPNFPAHGETYETIAGKDKKDE